MKSEADFRCSTCSRINSSSCDICTPTQGGFGTFHHALKPHRHAELIKKWIKDTSLRFEYNVCGTWHESTGNHSWNEDFEYREMVIIEDDPEAEIKKLNDDIFYLRKERVELYDECRSLNGKLSQANKTIERQDFALMLQALIISWLVIKLFV